MSSISSQSKAALDPVSFLFGQVLNQVDYLFESGHLSQQNYSTIAAALLQSTPPATPPSNHSLYATNVVVHEPNQYASSYFPSTFQGPPPQSQTGPVSLQQRQSTSAARKASTPSLLSFRSKSSKGKSKESSLPQTPFQEAEEPQLGRINRGVRKTLQGG